MIWQWHGRNVEMLKVVTSPPHLPPSEQWAFESIGDAMTGADSSMVRPSGGGQIPKALRTSNFSNRMVHDSREDCGKGKRGNLFCLSACISGMHELTHPILSSYHISFGLQKASPYHHADGLSHSFLFVSFCVDVIVTTISGAPCSILSQERGNYVVRILRPNDWHSRRRRRSRSPSCSKVAEFFPLASLAIAEKIAASHAGVCESGAVSP